MAVVKDALEFQATCGCTGWIVKWVGVTYFITAVSGTNCNHEPARKYRFSLTMDGENNGG